MKKLFVLILLIFPLYALANYQNNRDYPEAGVISSVSNDSIIMIEETVIYSNETFHTVFVFSNSSELTQHVYLGFPVYGGFSAWGNRISDNELYQESNQIKMIEEYYRFTNTFNGIPFKMSLYPGNGDYSAIYIGEIDFQPFQIAIISNSFHQQPDIFDQWTYYTEYELKYYLKSGATWKGNIGKSIFKYYIHKEVGNFDTAFNWLMYFGWESQPMPDKFYENTNTLYLEWIFTNYNPEFNIEVKWGIYNMFNSNFDLDTDIGEDWTGKAELIELFQDIDNVKEFVWEMSSEYMLDGNSLEPFILSCIYALNGYIFSDESCLSFFSQFDWYQPIADFYQLSDDYQTLVGAVSNSLIQERIDEENRAKWREDREIQLKKDKTIKVIIMYFISVIIIVIVILIKSKRNRSER